MIKPLSKFELDKRKAEKQSFYRQIKEVILPAGFEKCTRLFIGGCVKRGVGSSFRHKADAHCYKADKLFGTLCFRSIKRLGEYHTVANDDGTVTIIIDKPSRLVLHEYAHLLAPNQPHNKTFDRRYRELLKRG
jgi:hypothetical protein